MKLNLGRLDRGLRLCAGLALAVCCLMAPLPLMVSVLGGVISGYMLLSAFSGTCIGYTLLGRSTCSNPRSLSTPEHRG